MQETVSGVKVRGKWEEVVNRGKDVTEALEATEQAESHHLEEWEDWRPRTSEDLDDDHREKTVEKAVADKSPVEKEGKTAVEQAGQAVDDAGEAVEKAVKGEVDTASRKTRQAFFDALLSIDAAARKALRRFESFIYHHVIARANPHYFDSELVSASLTRKRGVTERFNDEEDEFEMTVSINDDHAKERFKEKMKETEN